MKSMDTKTVTNDFSKFYSATLNGKPIPGTEAKDIRKAASGKDFVSQVQNSVCNAGLGKVKDTYIHGWFSKVSLGEAIAKLDEFKHQMYEEIKSNITTYLPDAYRPAKLALDVARQLMRYAQIISCLTNVIGRIQEEIQAYLNEITEFMSELDDAINRLMDDLDYLIYDIANIPADIVSAISDGLVDAMEQSGIMAVFQAADALEDSIDDLRFQLDSLSEQLPNFADYTESQIRQILSTISNYPDELSDIFENLGDYTIDQIETSINMYQNYVANEIETGVAAIDSFDNAAPDDYTYGKELYKTLKAQKSSAQDTHDKYSSSMSPDPVVDDTQELLDYAEEISALVGPGGSGGVIGGGTSVLIINEFIMDVVKGYSTTESTPVTRPDTSFKVIYTNETGLDAALKREYDEYHDTLDGLDEAGGVSLISVTGGPGVIFPDGTSRFNGLARVGLHTDELIFESVTLTVEIDGETRGEFSVRGYGHVGMLVDDLDNPGDKTFQHFTQDLQLNTLTSSNGEIYPILFKESFELKIKKSDPSYVFQNPFFVEAGIRYMLLNKEDI